MTLDIEKIAQEANLPLVSIVVPIYNCERYIKKCMDTILSQTYTNIEVIVVDDGSTDKSGEVCDTMSTLDNRVKIIHKRNGGVSSARNYGLKQAQGQYICFIDSDDFIQKDYIETLVSKIGDMDCVSTGRTIVDESGKIPLEQVEFQNKKILGHENILKAYENSSEFRQSFFGPWCKLYRSDIAKHCLFDEELVSGEDIVFNLGYLKETDNVALCDYTGYYLRKNCYSATNTATMKYSPRSEHNYRLIDEKIDNARVKCGLSKSWIEQNRCDAAPMRFFLEITNLFRPGSPYKIDGIYRKIKEIHNDINFIDCVKSKNKKLTSAEKISVICAHVNIPIFTIIIAKLCQVFLEKRTINI